jgi:hypothetical protein
MSILIQLNLLTNNFRRSDSCFCTVTKLLRKFQTDFGTANKKIKEKNDGKEALMHVNG